MRIVFELPGQRMDDGKELTYIVRPLFVGTRVKDLLACIRDHAAIFHFARRATARRIHTNGWQDRLRAGCFPFSVRGGLAFEVIVFGEEGGFRFFTAPEGFILRADKALHLFFTFRP